jgi:hypothetical protein
VPATLERTGITEQTTAEFRDDLTRLNVEDRTRVMTTLRRNYEVLRNDRRGFFAKAKRPSAVRLKGGLTSSLYSLPASRDIRIIMAVDDDPVFAQTLVTLFRAVRHDELGRAFRLTAERIYRNQIETNGIR